MHLDLTLSTLLLPYISTITGETNLTIGQVYLSVGRSAEQLVLSIIHVWNILLIWFLFFIHLGGCWSANDPSHGCRTAYLPASMKPSSGCGNWSSAFWTNSRVRFPILERTFTIRKPRLKIADDCSPRWPMVAIQFLRSLCTVFRRVAGAGSAHRRNPLEAHHLTTPFGPRCCYYTTQQLFTCDTRDTRSIALKSCSYVILYCITHS